MRAQDHVAVDMPNVLRDRIARHRLHPRMAFHEVIEEALDFWEASGAWQPWMKAPVDGDRLWDAGDRWPARIPGMAGM